MNIRGSLQITESLALLQSRGDHFTRQIVHERQRVSQYESHLKEIQDEITKVREENKLKGIELLNKHVSTNNRACQRVDGSAPTRLAEEYQKKMVQNLEGRLNKCLIRNNSVQIENNAIKEKIDELRRKILNDKRKKEEIQDSLVQVQVEVDEIMRRAASVAEQRDKILELQSQLETVNEEERLQFEQEYRKLCQYIQEQKDLLKSSIMKVSSNVVSRLHTVKVDSIHKHNDDDKLRQESQKEGLKIRLEELEKHIALQRLTFKDERDKLKEYDENLSKLELVSGFSTLHEIVADFKKHEEESYSLFNYIQSVNQECDGLVKEKCILEVQLEHIQSTHKSAADERMIKIKKNRERLDEITKEKILLEASIDDGNKTIQAMRQYVESLLSKLKCKVDVDRNTNNSSTDIVKNHDEPFYNRDVLKKMELLEVYTIKMIEAYAKTLIDEPKRRPSILMSPKMFNRNSIGTGNTSTDSNLGESCDEEHDSDEEGSIGGRPISVQDMRKQHAERLKSPISSADKVQLVHSFFADSSNE